MASSCNKKVCTNYSSLGISTGGETEGDPVCSTVEALLEEEESSGDFNTVQLLITPLYGMSLQMS